MFDVGLVVFSGNDCQNCKDLKIKLEKSKTTYTEFNIHEDKDALAFLLSRGYRSIPVMFLNGQFLPL